MMHTLYATIRQNDCLDRMKGRRNPEATVLRLYFDIHDHIASWAQMSARRHDTANRGAGFLDQGR